MVTELAILYEDNHLLAVLKPAGLPTMGAPAGSPTLLSLAKEYIKFKYRKPGAVYLGVVSRLDAPVTGVVLLARTSKAASRLSKAFRERDVEKRYLAGVEGTPHPAEQRLVHHLRKDERHRRVHVTHAEAPDASRAELAFETTSLFGDNSLLLVRPVTGRKHQIRVQLAKVGHPVLGDRKYGAATTFAEGVALHAWRLEIEHPVRHEPVQIDAPLPAKWPKRFQDAVARIERVSRPPRGK